MFEEFKRLLSSIGIYGLGRVGTQALAFLLLPVYTRFLLPADYGLLEIILLIPSLVGMISILAMDNALFRFYFDSDNPEEQQKVISTVATFILCFSTFFIGSIMFLSPGINSLLFSDRNHILLIVIGLLMAYLQVNSMVPNSLFRIRDQPRQFIIISLSSFIITAGLNIFFVAGLKKGAFGVLLGTSLGALFTFILLWVWQRRDFKISISFSLLKKMLIYSIPVMPAGTFAWIMALSDRWFLLEYSTMTELGLYGVGNKIGKIMMLVVMTFQLGWPQFIFSVMNRKDAQAIYSRSFTYFILGTGFIFLLLSLLAEEVLIVMTTPPFFSAYIVVPLLCLGVIFYGAYFVFAVGIGIKRKTQFMPVVVGLPAGLNLLLNYLWIPRWGMMGAAWATTLSYLLMAILMFLNSEMYYKISYEWGRVAKVSLVTAIIFTAGWTLQIESIYLSLLLKGILILSYFPILWLIRFYKDEELHRVKSFITSIRTTST